MVAVREVSHAVYQQIRGSSDNNIAKCADLSGGIVIEDYKVGESFLVGKGDNYDFLTGHTYYLHDDGVFYGCEACRGINYFDGEHFYVVSEDGSVSKVQYKEEAASSIASIESSIGKMKVSVGPSRIEGLTASAIAGVATMMDNVLKIHKSGIFAIHIDITHCHAATLSTEVFNRTSERLLASGTSVKPGYGVSANYIGPLKEDDEVAFYIISNMSGSSSINISLTNI